MPRVVTTKNVEDLQDANSSCPVQAFRKGPNGDLVIDPTVCIDCGVCQSIAKEGAILEDSEATPDVVAYNEETAKNGEEA